MTNEKTENRSDDAQPPGINSSIHDVASSNIATETKSSTSEKLVAKGPIKRTRRKQSRKGDEIVDEFQRVYENECMMNYVFNPSFNGILRAMPMNDGDDRDFLEGVRTYLTERREQARTAIELGNKLSDLRKYVRFHAKLAVVDVVLSTETQETVRRILGSNIKATTLNSAPPVK